MAGGAGFGPWRPWPDPEGVTPLTAVTETEYKGFGISVTEDGNRFTPRVRHAGRMVEHDGKASQVWAAASCASGERALQIAQAAIDTGRVK